MPGMNRGSAASLRSWAGVIGASEYDSDPAEKRGFRGLARADPPPDHTVSPSLALFPQPESQPEFVGRLEHFRDQFVQVARFGFIELSAQGQHEREHAHDTTEEKAEAV